MLIATKMEQAYSHWYKYAVDQNCAFFDVHHIKGAFITAERDLMKCLTKVPDFNILKRFLNNNINVIFVSCDKSSNLCLMYNDDYFSKLYDVFSDNSKFIDITNVNSKHKKK